MNNNDKPNICGECQEHREPSEHHVLNPLHTKARCKHLKIEIEATHRACRSPWAVRIDDGQAALL